jgi:hypothetical protein
MVDDDRDKFRHAEGGALHFGFVQELGRDDDRGRASQAFKANTVMRTARGA